MTSHKTNLQMDSPSLMVKDVVFGKGSPYSQDDDSIREADPSMALQLQAKIRHYACVEANGLIGEEMQRRKEESNHRAQFAKKLIQKKTHQIMINEIISHISGSTRKTQSQVEFQALLSDFEEQYRQEIVSDARIVEIVIDDLLLQVNESYEKSVVNTVWSEAIEETAEQLLELPHPIPKKPEICTSFADISSRLDENDNTEELNDQSIQQVSPEPTKKPQKFLAQTMSDLSISIASQISSLKKDVIGMESPNPRHVTKNKSISSSDIQHSHSGQKKQQQRSSDAKKTVSLADDYFTTSHLARNRPSQVHIAASVGLQTYMNASNTKEQMNNISLRQSQQELKQSQLKIELTTPLKEHLSNQLSARSANRNGRNQSFSQRRNSCATHISKHSLDKNSDIQSSNAGKHYDEMIVAKTREPELKVDTDLAMALGQVSARTFQAFLSKRYHNFELAYLITLVSSLYEDSIPLNNSQTDLIYKNGWDDISRQLFNAGRIIRSLTKLKYSASSEGSSDFIKKLNRIQFSRRFENLQYKFESNQIDTNEGSQIARQDYHSAVKALYNVLIAINKIHERSSRNDHGIVSSDLEGVGDILSPNYLMEIEETKSDTNSTNAKHKRNTSNPRYVKPRVQAVKIDLHLPLQLNLALSRTHALGSHSTAASSKRNSTQVQTTNSARATSVTNPELQGVAALKAQVLFNNALSQKLTNSNSRSKQQTTGVSRNIVSRDRNSMLQPQMTNDFVSFTKSSQGAKQSIVAPPLPKKSEQLERIKRQAQFQQSLTDYISKEQQAKKQVVKPPPVTQTYQTQTKPQASSFLKPQETQSQPLKIQTPQSSSSKTFLKVIQPQVPYFHSPSISISNPQVQSFSGAGNWNNSPSIHSQSELRGQQSGPSSLSKNRQQVLPTTVTNIQNMLQTASASKPPRQITEGLIGSQHDERMRRQMAVLIKLAEPVRSKHR